MMNITFFRMLTILVKVPKGGVHWKVFGETVMKEYTFFDKEGNEWIEYVLNLRIKLKNLIRKNSNSRIHVSA